MYDTKPRLFYGFGMGPALTLQATVWTVDLVYIWTPGDLGFCCASNVGHVARDVWALLPFSCKETPNLTV